jgi:hypothetical protein
VPANILGPALLVAFRLGAYTQAAWKLLTAEAEQNVDAAHVATPFQEYCAAVKLLLLHKVLQGIQAQLSQVHMSSSSHLEQCLHHVLLWQYLKRCNILQLVEVSVTSRQLAARHVPHRTGTFQAPATNFLMALGVPLLLEAVSQVRPLQPW